MNKYYFTTQLIPSQALTCCLTTISILSLVIRFTIKVTMKTLRPHTKNRKNIEPLLDN